MGEVKRKNTEAIPKPPVVIFAYNRPIHLKNCIESLIANKNATEHKYIVFIDGPKNKSEEDLIRQVERIANSFSRRIDIEVKKSEKNKGLSSSVISGVTETLSRSDSVIVVEDDLELHPEFLNFMAVNLCQFRENEMIASIQGFTYPIFDKSTECYYLRGADCWGWGTWKNRWDLLELDSSKLLNQINLRNLNRAFDLEGSFPYTKMLARQAKGEVDSWAIRWHASMYLSGKFSLYPPVTLVRNNGFDGSGTHVSKNDREGYKEFVELIYKIPPEIDEARVVRRKLISFLRKKYGTYPVFHPLGFFSRIKRRIYE